MSKELFIAAHEAEIEDYLEAHPEASGEEAYDVTVDSAYLRMQDMLADQIDRARDTMKERGL